jgi:membrane fusion protein, heavy metal efflux system
MALGRTKTKAIAALGALALALAAGVYLAGYIPSRLPFGPGPKTAIAATESGSQPADAGHRASGGGPRADSLELTEKQRETLKVEAIAEHAFPLEKQSIGSIDFNQDLTLQVFAPYQGRIIRLFAEVGDDVKKGQTLFTIDSPDLLQAESTLIAAAGVLELTTRNLARLKELYQTRAVSQKDLEQAVSDQQTAEGNLRAARDAVRIFGKVDADIDGIVSRRLADPTLIVPSPIDGRITARNAAPGLFVQPGSAPAPFSVADVSTMWMLANVAESDSPALHVGQEVKVSVAAFPDKVFEGRVSTIGSMVDPNTRRVLVRSEVTDPRHELRAGMFANFVIRTGDPMRSPGVPLDGVVREGDGTMTVWVTTDRRRFTKRTVEIGLEHDGYRQILEGLQPGELVATDGAIFLSNMLATARPQ